MKYLPRLLSLVFVIAATTCALCDSIRNPGFETIGGSGNPEEWLQFREAFIDQDAALAHSGNNSVRSSFLFSWTQSLAAPCSPYESFAIAGWARTEFPDERVRIRVACFTTGGSSFIGDLNNDSPLQAANPYSPFWTTHRLPAQTAQLNFYLGGALQHSWIRFDDLELFTEQFHTTTTDAGEPWTFTGGSFESSGEIQLPAGSSVRQRVVTGSPAQGYFIAGRYDAVSPATLRVLDEWLPRADTETTQTLLRDLVLPPAVSTPFTADLDRPTTDSSGQSLVTLEALSGDFALKDIKRGFAAVEPTTLTVGLGTPDLGLKLTAAVPRRLTTATVEILDPTNALVAALPAQSHGTSVRAEWSPSSATTGLYKARFTLTCDDGQTIEVFRPFDVIAQTAPDEIPRFNRADFTRCAWLFLYFETSDARIDETFALARQDGFNYVMAHCRLDQLGVVRAAAEREGLPFFIQTAEVRRIYAEYLARDTFSKEDYIARVRSLIAPVLASPLYEGVYVVDEPISPQQLSLNRRANLSIDQAGDLGRGYSVVGGTAVPADLASLEPPVGMVDIYPFTAGAYDNPVPVRAMIPLVNAFVHALAADSRDLWLVLQGFEGHDLLPVYEFYRSVPPSAHWAQLGVAVMAGARGVSAFTYTSINHMEGLRGRDLEATPKLEVHRRFNTLMDRIGPLVMQLAAPVIDTRAPVPFAVSVAERTVTDKYVYALNTHDLTTHTLMIEFSPAPTGPLDDLILERQLAPLGDGRVPVLLGPGEWALIPCGNRTIQSFSMTADTGPVLSTLTLPVSHEFTVTLAGEPRSPIGLTFNEAGDEVAVSTPFSLAPESPRVFHLNTDGTTLRIPGPARYPVGRTFFMGSRLVESTEILGARLYPSSNIAGAPTASFLGYTGGVYDLAETSGALWSAAYGSGVRRIADGSGALQSIEGAGSESEVYTDVLTLPGSVDAWLSIRNHGVDRVSPGTLAEEFHQRAASIQSHEGFAFNGGDLLAVPRSAHGVDLVRIRPDAAPQVVAVVAAECIDAVAVTWLYNDILVVADSVYHLRFYRLQPNLVASLIGTWRPNGPAPLLFRSLAAHGQKVAAGLQDGRVLVIQTSPTIAATAAYDWQLYE